MSDLFAKNLVLTELLLIFSIFPVFSGENKFDVSFTNLSPSLIFGYHSEEKNLLSLR